MTYRDFYDVPRLIAVDAGSGWYLLDCPFDDNLDEYGDIYRILRVRDADVPLLAHADWRPIVRNAEPIGMIPVADVRFDPTRRRSIDAAALLGRASGDE